MRKYNALWKTFPIFLLLFPLPITSSSNLGHAKRSDAITRVHFVTQILQHPLAPHLVNRNWYYVDINIYEGSLKNVLLNVLQIYTYYFSQPTLHIHIFLDVMKQSLLRLLTLHTCAFFFFANAHKWTLMSEYNSA